jgi:hypothetical protein
VITYLWNLTAKRNKNKPAETLANPKGRGRLSGRERGLLRGVGPEGKTLATTDTNGHVYLWTVP